jgi:hypothetical protein
MWLVLRRRECRAALVRVGHHHFKQERLKAAAEEARDAFREILLWLHSN